MQSEVACRRLAKLGKHIRSIEISAMAAVLAASW
jgi:hypothetical protein